MKRTRYYLDTEFNERPGLLDLISIGIVCEDGRELYAVSSEFDAIQCNDWVLANVIPKLAKDYRETRAQIRDRLLAFVGDTKPEVWGYFADYDWVCLCWLFGAMVDLPKGWPFFCLDLKQVMHERGLHKSDLPEQPDDAHNALADARWLKEAHEVVLKRDAYVEPRVAWRGSVSDVATDLCALLTPEQLRRLIQELHEVPLDKHLADTAQPAAKRPLPKR